jgi:transglutaminase-like putative cysteine protease
MRLVIDHQTRYSFSEPQARVVQLLRMTPPDTASQTVIGWQIEIDCDARLSPARDGYGNIATMLYVDGPVEAITITVRGEVMTDGGVMPLRGPAEPVAPLTYLRATALTDMEQSIADLAKPHLELPPMERAYALSASVNERIDARPGRTALSRTASDVLRIGQGSVRDCAHVLIAAARASGLPARFVSGHCLKSLNTDVRQSSHGWAEIWIDGTGWIGFDPSMGCRPGESYVRVAVGMDASDATPVSGARRGGGIEELDVGVRVAASQ